MKGFELCSEITEDTLQICAKSEGYKKYVNPNYPNPTPVKLEIITRSVLNVDEENHMIEIVSYSNSNWMDPRIDLKSNHSQRPKFGKSDLNFLWRPQIHYSNAVSASSRVNHIRVWKDSLTGNVWIKKVLLYNVKLVCDMDFTDFPFDTNSCLWKFRSYETEGIY